MLARRYLVGLVVVLAAAGNGRAQSTKYNLAETLTADTCFRVELTMALQGEMKVQQEGKTVTLKQTAQASHDYFERIMKGGSAGMADKAARHYKAAQAVITVDGDKTERTFRSARSLLAAHRTRDQLFVYSPKPREPMTREEVELTEHFDTLVLPGLLPGKEAAVGDTWKVHNAAAQFLCGLDGLTRHDLTGKLVAVNGDIAQLALTGNVEGIAMGAEAKMTIDATVLFDLKAKHITRVEWKQTDRREQGPVSPALDIKLTTTVVRTPLLQPPDELNDLVLVIIESELKPEHLQLAYRDAKGRFAVTYAREWQTVARTDEHLVLRLMDRGDFVAQATLTPWKKVEPGKHLSTKEFQALMTNAPGWTEKHAMDKDGAKELEVSGGNHVYRYAALGELNGHEVVQYFYLVASPQGDQLFVTFTMTQGQVQKLGTSDLEMIRNISFGRGESNQARIEN